MTNQSRRVVETLTKFIASLSVDLGTTVTSEVTNSTPVLTGFAANNWVPRINETFAGTAGTREGALSGLLDRGPKEVGLMALSSVYQFPQIINITNNVTYINALNSGTSAKAPPAFVQLAIAKSILMVLRRRGS